MAPVDMELVESQSEPQEAASSRMAAGRVSKPAVALGIVGLVACAFALGRFSSPMTSATGLAGQTISLAAHTFTSCADAQSWMAHGQHGGNFAVAAADATAYYNANCLTTQAPATTAAPANSTASNATTPNATAAPTPTPTPSTCTEAALGAQMAGKSEDEMKTVCQTFLNACPTATAVVAGRPRCAGVTAATTATTPSPFGGHDSACHQQFSAGTVGKTDAEITTICNTYKTGTNGACTTTDGAGWITTWCASRR